MFVWHDAELAVILTTVIVASTTLMGIAVALAAAIPALVEIARTRSPNYLSGELARTHLRSDMTVLGISVALFAAAAMLGAAGLFCSGHILATCGVATMLLGMLVLAALGLRLLAQAKHILRA